MDINLQTLREGICSYNNMESAVGIRRGGAPSPRCLCHSFPLGDEYDELEYGLALERKGPVEIFGFLCEWGMMPTPLWERLQDREAQQALGKGLSSVGDG